MPVGHIHSDSSSVTCLGPLADFRTYNWWRWTYPHSHQRAPQDRHNSRVCAHKNEVTRPRKGLVTGQLSVVMSLWLDCTGGGILFQLFQHGGKVTILEHARDLWIYKTEDTYQTTITVMDHTKVLKVWYHAPKMCTASYKGRLSGHTWCSQ